LQKFLKHGKDYANLLALYSFYLYHAQQQKTNQPLATDDFTRRGLNWASDRVKKTKKILKEMKIIEVVQYKKYYYVHLFFIYTKKKIDKILVNSTENQKPLKEELLVPKKEEVVKPAKVITSVTTVPTILDKWLEYCNKNSINYTKSNLSHWENKLKKRVSIDKKEAVYNAINKGWKNFYIVSTEESKYHKFLGKSLMMEKDCNTLIDIGFKDNKFVYQFKNIRVFSAIPPLNLFNKYGYDNNDVKTAPISTLVKDKIMGMFQRF
jgi:hypothetical protein